MRVSKEQSARLRKILTSIAKSCDEAIRDMWDRSDDGFCALRRAAEEGLTILGCPLPDYDEDGDEDEAG